MGFIKNWRNRKEMAAMAEGKAMADAKAKAQAERTERAVAQVTAARDAALAAYGASPPPVFGVVTVSPDGSPVYSVVGPGKPLVQVLDAVLAHVRERGVSLLKFEGPPAPPPVPTPKGVIELKGVPSPAAEP